jgi:hypothetical protein
MKMLERYCKKCGNEIVKEGEVCTMYEGKKLCECNLIKSKMKVKNDISERLKKLEGEKHD